jgi:integrase
LTIEELARLGDALREGETLGLPYSVDETKPTAEHAPKVDHRGVRLDRFATAAIRLLILTGARLREILHAKWAQIDLERGLIFPADSKTGKKPLYLSAAAQEVLADIPRIEGNPPCDGWSEGRRAAGRPEEAMGCCEAGRRFGGRPLSRPAPLVCFIRRRRVSRFADHREAARSLAAGDDCKVCAFGRGPNAPRGEHD